MKTMNYRQILNERLKLYLQAERDILSGQSVEVEGMKLTRADLDIVRRQINNLRNELDESGRVMLGQPRSRVRSVVPL